MSLSQNVHCARLLISSSLLGLSLEHRLTSRTSINIWQRSSGRTSRSAGPVSSTNNLMRSSISRVALSVGRLGSTRGLHLAALRLPVRSLPSASLAISASRFPARRSLATAVTRGSFKALTAEDIAYFRSVLSSPSSLLTTIEGGGAVATNDELVGFNQDWMNKYKGRSQCVIKPKTTEEVSKVMSYCYQQGIAVVPQGGNTGLVGGSVPVFDEVVLSLASMNNIRDFDAVSGESSRCHLVNNLLTNLQL